jgi:hypothetical protein
MAKSSKKIEVLGVEISIVKKENLDYISLTDMIKSKDGDFFISDWLRNRNTVEFIGIWETVFNPSFNYGEFAIIKSKAGLNNYKLSVKEWVNKTNSIGIISKAGRFGGTYAHPDIALEFGMWISAEFKIFLIKEFQRLKEEETNQKNLTWNVQRIISKINYKIHTDAIKENLIPSSISKEQAAMIYANEADLLNVALFGLTAQQWKDNNPTKDGNIRDEATIEQLVVLSNMESINALLIQQNLPQFSRIVQLNQVAISQMKSLLGKLESKLLISKNEKFCK